MLFIIHLDIFTVIETVEVLMKWYSSKIVFAVTAKEGRRIVTNYDRIKSMSVEEMANALFAFKECNKDCPIVKHRKHCYMLCDSESAIKKWLEQEISE